MSNLSGANIGLNFKGLLNLGSTINTPLSTTLQAVTDGDGNTTPLQLATNRIALGTATGTSLLNFPDAGTTAADGISFGTGLSTLYRNSVNGLKTDGSFAVGAGYAMSATYLGSVSGSKIYTNTGLTIGSWVTNTNFVDIVASTLTGSSATSALSIAQTWNTTGNPTAIFANITNTASGATSNLIDLQVGGVSQFKINKAGVIGLKGIFAGDIFNLAADQVGAFQTGIQFSSASWSKMFIYASGGIVGSISKNDGWGCGFSSQPNASAQFEIQSITKGFLPPRMTTAQRDLIATPAEGLIIYNTSTNRPNFFDGTSWAHI
jgi:hypothetical protein